MNSKAYCADPDNALAEAEATCVRKIAEVLGLRVGVDAFTFDNPGVMDCAVFDIGYLQTGEQMAFPAGVFNFRAQCDFYNRSRAKLQKWLGKLMNALPISPWQGRTDEIRAEGNVITLRFAPVTNGIGQIRATSLDNGDTYLCETHLDVVFTSNPQE